MTFVFPESVRKILCFCKSLGVESSSLRHDSHLLKSTVCIKRTFHYDIVQIKLYCQAIMLYKIYYLK